MITKTQHETMKRKHTTEKTEMKSLVTIINELQNAGYKTQFKATVIGLLSLSTMNMFKPFEIKIVHYYRFEGESDPSDNSIVYAIKTLFEINSYKRFLIKFILQLNQIFLYMVIIPNFLIGL